MKYAVVIEKAEGNYSAYVPDLPGCVATGATVEEVAAEIREAITFHPIFLSCPSAKCRKRRLGAGLARVREGTKWVSRNLP